MDLLHGFTLWIYYHVLLFWIYEYSQHSVRISQDQGHQTCLTALDTKIQERGRISDQNISQGYHLAIFFIAEYETLTKYEEIAIGKKMAPWYT